MQTLVEGLFRGIAVAIGGSTVAMRMYTQIMIDRINEHYSKPAPLSSLWHEYVIQRSLLQGNSTSGRLDIVVYVNLARTRAIITDIVVISSVTSTLLPHARVNHHAEHVQLLL